MNVPVNADGTFRLSNITPGDYRIEISGFPVNVSSGGVATGTQFVATLQGNGYLKEARLDGADVLSSPLHFSGTTSTGLDILVGLGGGQINGTVTDVRSQPVPGTRVVIVPDRARHRADLYRTSMTDANGRFSMSSVPPGDYKVFAWETIDEYAWFDPDFLGRFEAAGRAVRVVESAAQAVEVRIIPAEGAR